MWRRIDKTERDVLATAHSFEKEFPRFYQDASNGWTTTTEAAFSFYDSCSHLYGIFDGDLVGFIYFRPITDTHYEVHLEAKRGIDKEFLLNAIREIRDEQLKEVTSIETWVLRQNAVLRDMLTNARFRRTGLEMRSGQSHGRILRWIQMVVRSYDEKGTENNVVANATAEPAV